MITLTLLALLYFLPTILAAHRGHGIAGILLLNLFFGWTVLGWFALLLWALLSTPYYRVYPVPGAYYPPNEWRR
jgi:Superinfection immunity protein